jgi:hypothetical protein
MKILKENAKAAIAFFTSLGGWSATAFSDNGLTAGEVIAGVCLVGAATFGVWVVDNAPTAGQLEELDKAINP